MAWEGIAGVGLCSTSDFAVIGMEARHTIDVAHVQKETQLMLESSIAEYDRLGDTVASFVRPP